MTKISCTECRERLGELLAAEVAPVHAGHNGAASSDLSVLRAHVSECEECAQSLKVLRATRETMRDFTPLAAPLDLRDRIRARVENEPAPFFFAHGIHEGDNHNPETLDTAEEALAMVPGIATAGHTITGSKNKTTPFVPIVPQLPVRKKKFTVRTLRREFVQFFNRPSNVAWASGMAIAFCIILIARPRPEPSTSFQTPAPETIARSSRVTNDSEKVLAQKPNSKTDAKVTVRVIGTPVPNAIPRVPNIAPLPGLPPARGDRYPFKFPGWGAAFGFP
jgi:hypothetical protein